LGEGVSTVMAAQRKDTLKDAQLRVHAQRKAARADQKVVDFAAKERAKEMARHELWETQAKRERGEERRASHSKKVKFEQKLHAAHVRQQEQTGALKAVETRAEGQLKELEAQRATLLGGSHSQDATLMNQGVRMTRLFEGKEKVNELRQQYKAARKEVMVNKGALRLAQRQLDRLKARAESGDLSQSKAHDELEAHEKAMGMLKQRVREVEKSSQQLEHKIFLAS